PAHAALSSFPHDALPIYWGKRIDFEDTEIHDTARGGSLFEHISFMNALFDANTANPAPPATPPGKDNQCGMQFYDTNVNVSPLLDRKSTRLNSSHVKISY